jgi:hypothetical protein
MLAVMHEEMGHPMLRLLRQLRPDQQKVREQHSPSEADTCCFQRVA